MKFLVEYTHNNVDCTNGIEAENLAKARQIAKEWRATRLRFRNATIKITKITPIEENNNLRLVPLTLN